MQLRREGLESEVARVKERVEAVVDSNTGGYGFWGRIGEEDDAAGTAEKFVAALEGRDYVLPLPRTRGWGTTA